MRYRSRLQEKLVLLECFQLRTIEISSVSFDLFDHGFIQSPDSTTIGSRVPCCEKRLLTLGGADSRTRFSRDLGPPTLAGRRSAPPALWFAPHAASQLEKPGGAGEHDHKTPDDRGEEKCHSLREMRVRTE